MSVPTWLPERRRNGPGSPSRRTLRRRDSGPLGGEANATDGNPANNRVNVAQTGAPLPVPSPQPVPSASGINASSGPAGGGTTVTVTGSDLMNGLVMFGTAPGTNNSCSATSCTATSPAGAGTVHLAVLTPGGMSAPSSADLFAFQGSPPPAPVPGVTNLSSGSGPAAGGTNTYVLGSNLAGGTVSFGDTPGRNTSCGPSFCSTTSPPGTGTVDVTVTTASGTSALGPADRFTYETASTAALSISTVGGGTVSGAAAGSYLLGTVVTLTANPNVGYAVSSWTIDGAAAGSANSYTLTMDRDHRVVATFAPVPTSGPTVGLSPSSLDFGSQRVGTTSSARMVGLTNIGGVPLSITKIALGGSNPGQFTRSSACPSTLAVGANCTISVTFKPTSRGSKNAVLSITDNAPNSPQTVALNGRAQKEP